MKTTTWTESQSIPGGRKGKDVFQAKRIPNVCLLSKAQRHEASSVDGVVWRGWKAGVSGRRAARAGTQRGQHPNTKQRHLGAIESGSPTHCFTQENVTSNH